MVVTLKGVLGTRYADINKVNGMVVTLKGVLGTKVYGHQ